jgi:type VI secretion system secreted protein VgrG
MSESANRQVFELSFGGGVASGARVVSFTGKEQLSRPFRFDVTVAVSSQDAGRFAADVLGAAGVLTMSAEATPRHVRGFVSRVALAAVDLEKHVSWFVVRLVPKLWTLGMRKTSRIFQDKSVPEIVTDVLGGAGVAHQWRIARTYGKRPYSVQYQETDLDYVARLLAEEGIFYFFEDSGEDGGSEASEVVVLADLAAHYPAIQGEARLPFAPPFGLMSHGDGVEAFSAREKIRSGATRVKHFDFRRPDTDLSSSSAAAPRPRFDEGALEVYEYDFAAEDDSVVASGASRRLEQLRVRSAVGAGRSRCLRVAAGRRFTLEGHPEDALNREYVVVKMTHQGRQPEETFGLPAGAPVEVYKNDFECLPASVAARPPRRPRRMQQVLETATVVGPEGEEIHTDEHGRIKVAFHWDRRGRRDEHSSCWIRCMQTWAGASWGFQFIPRVGMEVLVTFMGGDVDQPMVIGCAHNGTHPPPFPLPASKTKSGIRTRSTPGGEGSNELSFEDAAGKEQIYVHAQRDLEEVVENDHRRLVRANEEILVQGTRESIVGEDHYRTVRGNEVVTIEKDLILHVVGRQRIVIEGRAPSDGPGDGEGGEPPPAPTMIEPVLAAAPSAPVVPSWLPADQAAEQLAHAKLIWSMASLPEELQAQGADIERRTTAVSVRVAKLCAEVATWLASGRPDADADALRSCTTDVRTEVLHAMVEAGMAVDARMSKLRDAAQHVLTSALVETQRAQIALVGGDPSRAGVAGSYTSRGGVGRGGGGALPTTKDKQAQAFNIESRDLRANQPYNVTTSDASVMDFSTGGKITSPVALALEVGGTKLTMTPAGIEIHAPFISLKSDGEIHIDAGGNVVVKGVLITLN